MKANHIFPALLLIAVFGAAVAFGQPAPQEAIPNWSAPATWTPAAQRGTLHTMSAITSPLPFIGLTPCRLVDTRGTVGVPINTGGAFSANEIRTWTFTGLCGIPSGAAAVSLNVTVTNTQSNPFGFVAIWPGGTSEPNVSTLNWSTGGLTEANAAVVPLGTGGSAGKISLQTGNAGADVIVDTNGYYAAAGTGSFNTFLGVNAGNVTMTGDYNTGFGQNTLFHNTTGLSNTAIGEGALFNNTTGFYNTATGQNALLNNTTGCCNAAIGTFALSSNVGGGVNTAIGTSALINNTSGSANTATGYEALFSNTTDGNNTATGYRALRDATGFNNTAVGSAALLNDTTGTDNTATGSNALTTNTTGAFNTAVGAGALQNTTGSSNIGIGRNGGINLTTGSNEICIGNSGVAGESATIRIGTVGTQTAAFVAGVNGVTTGGTGIPVLIDSNGQLGTISSSARFKDEIQDMGDATEGLLKLRPVTFRYKAQPEGRTQYGLIAEEVEKVMPELVVCSPAGEVETVLYHEMPAMLLNELQKQQREIQELKSELTTLRAIAGHQ